MTACRVLHSRSTYFLRNIAICSNFYFLKSTSFKKYTIQWPMGHSEDDVVHKRLNKMKMHWQNRLKFLVLVYDKVFFRTRYKKIDVILVQCPFKWGKMGPKNKEKEDKIWMDRKERKKKKETEKAKIGKLLHLALQTVQPIKVLSPQPGYATPSNVHFIWCKGLFIKKSWQKWGVTCWIFDSKNNHMKNFFVYFIYLKWLATAFFEKGLAGGFFFFSNQSQSYTKL